MADPLRPSRRVFLKAGLAGGLLLAGVGGWYALEVGRDPALAGRLGPAERSIVGAVAGVILDGVLPSGAEARRQALVRAVDGVGVAIAGLAPAAQDELAELFGLLRFPPTRALLGGLWTAWDQAGSEEVRAFLDGWRYSRMALLQSAYAALHDLVTGAWYGDAGHWEAIGYPGPPEVL